MFEGKCAVCGKKVYLTTPDGVGFCSRVCEGNYKWEHDKMYKANIVKR